MNVAPQPLASKDINGLHFGVAQKLIEAFLAAGAAVFETAMGNVAEMGAGAVDPNITRFHLLDEALGAPVCERIVDDPRLRALYGRDIFLIRPDLHIAWRGNAAPDNPERLAALVTGQWHT